MAGMKFSRETLKGLNKTPGDFNLAHRFTLEIDKVSIGGVHTVKGLSHENETVEYQDGDDAVTRFRAGRQKQSPIEVTRDFSGNKEFYNWRKTVIDGDTARRSVSIVLLNDKGEESSRINLHECLPIAWVGPDLNSRSSGHASETLKILFETMDWA